MKTLQLILALGLIGITVPGCVHRSQTQSDPYLVAKVVRISEEYANINTDVSGAQLHRWGIARKESFIVKYKDHQVRALLGTGYGDVARGEWIALIEEDGLLQLAINFGNAATAIGCAVGDTLYLEALGEGN
jgi:S-adenosylmethionine hydrolase